MSSRVIKPKVSEKRKRSKDWLVLYLLTFIMHRPGLVFNFSIFRSLNSRK